MHKFFVYLLSLGHLSVDFAPGALPAILPFLVLYNGLSYTEVAGLMFASSCLSSIVQPVFGYWADKSPKQWFMALGIAMSGIGLGISGLFANYWLIFTAITLMGVGSSIFHPVAARTVNRISEQNKATGIGIFSVGGNLGFGVAPMIAAAALSFWGTSGTIIFLVFGLLTSALMIWAIPKMVATVRAEVARTSASQTKQDEGTNDWRAFSHLTFLILFRSIAQTSVLAFLPLYCIYRFGISEEFSGLLLSVLCLSGAFMTVFGGYLSDKLGLIRACRLGYFFMAPAFALLLLVPSIWWIFPILVLISFTLNGTYASFVVLGQSYLAKNVGLASGVTMGLSASLGGIFTPILGMVADNYGITTVMVILVVVGALCAISSFLLPQPQSK